MAAERKSPSSELELNTDRAPAPDGLPSSNSSTEKLASSLNTSHRITRAAALASRPDSDSEFASFLETANLLAPRIFPVEIYEEHDGGQRRCVTSDDTYKNLREDVQMLLTHMVESKFALFHVVEILNIMHAKLPAGEKKNVAIPDAPAVIDYLTTHPPKLIFKKLGDDVGDTSWRFVLKGNGKDARENEMFITQELLSVLRNGSVPPLDILSVDRIAIQKRLRLVFCICFLHELTHAITKWFYGGIPTPKIGSFGQDRGVHGEAGYAFEKRYLNFVLQVSWLKADHENEASRMWKVSQLVAKGLQSSLLVLDDQSVGWILDAFRHDIIWVPSPESLSRYVHNDATHIRRRMDTAEEEEEEELEVDDGSIIFQERCGVRGKMDPSYRKQGLGLSPSLTEGAKGGGVSSPP